MTARDTHGSHLLFLLMLPVAWAMLTVPDTRDWVIRSVLQLHLSCRYASSGGDNASFVKLLPPNRPGSFGALLHSPFKELLINTVSLSHWNYICCIFSMFWWSERCYLHPIFHITTSDDCPFQVFSAYPSWINFFVRKGLSWFINFNTGC